jgi:hypothetical protein
MLGFGVRKTAKAAGLSTETVNKIENLDNKVHWARGGFTDITIARVSHFYGLSAEESRMLSKCARPQWGGPSRKRTAHYLDEIAKKLDELLGIVEVLSDEMDGVKKRLDLIENGPKPSNGADERAWHGAWQPWAGWAGGRER